MRHRRSWVPGLLLGVLASCGPDTGARIVPPESGATDISVARPSFTLTDTDGRPFDFRARTAGRLTFLEFGFTNCPDVCPVHMANLAAVLGKLTPSDRSRIDVVFVSVDPDRDSLAVLRKWLDAFDVSFIGLTGTREAVDSAQAMVGFGPAIIQVGEDGATTVMHAAPVVVFTADDTAHVMYPFGTRQADWTRDIPRLLAVPPASGLPAGGAAAPRGAGAPTVAVVRTYIVIPAGNAPAALYLEAANYGTVWDSIVSVDAGDLGPATLHETMDHGDGTTMMQPVTGVPVPAGAYARLAPGTYHGMIGPLRRPIVRGQRIPLTLHFARGGRLGVEARVISYADVDTATAPSPI